MIELIEQFITPATILGMMGIVVWFVLKLARLPKNQHSQAINTLNTLRKWLPLSVISRLIENQMKSDNRK